MPATVGAKSTKEKDAIIILRDGQEKLIFPGKRGYATAREDGALVLPTTPSPSGHLLVSRGHFSEAENAADHVVHAIDRSIS